MLQTCLEGMRCSVICLRAALPTLWHWHSHWHIPIAGAWGCHGRRRCTQSPRMGTASIPWELPLSTAIISSEIASILSVEGSDRES